MNTLPMRIPVLAAVVALCMSASAMAQDNGTAGIRLPLLASPTGETVYVLPDEPQPRPDPSWILRTGIKKGILDHSLDRERFAGADAAVLKNGFFQPWPRFLAEAKEASVLVDAKSIPGLEKTKPYLIIPSGALHGYSRSVFVKAALSEYARAGGVIICFAQQQGEDFTSLPVPEGSALTAAGWQQDHGPLFRASRVQSRHMILAGIRNFAPAVETSGYLTTFPKTATVVLSRPDGYPTLLVYPFGLGWVVVTTLFSDYSFGQDLLNQDEKVLVRNLLLWAKAPSQIVEASPGEQAVFSLPIQGPLLGKASSVKIKVFGPDVDALVTEMTLKAEVTANQVVPLVFYYAVPADIQPGMYHVEYVLQSSDGQAISSSAECAGGRFSIGQPNIAPPLPRLQQPLGPVQTSLRFQPSLANVGNALRLKMDILPGAAAEGDSKQTYLIRAAGREKLAVIGAHGESLSLDLPAQNAGKNIFFALYHPEGRSLIRGSLPVDAIAGSNVTLDKPIYRSGENVNLTLRNIGNGEFTLTAPGHREQKMIAGLATASFKVPEHLPAGTYRAEWKVAASKGTENSGEVPITIDGYRVSVQDAVMEHTEKNGVYQMNVRLRVHATHAVTTRVKLSVLGPDSVVIPVSESPVSLAKGVQEVPLAFSFEPKAAGLWELHYTIDAQLPKTPGLTAGPVVIAAGQAPFDVGSIALLGVATSSPVYNRPSGPVNVTAYVVGSGKATLRFLLDNKNILNENIKLSGPYTFTTPLPDITPGPHTVSVLVADVSPQSRTDHQFLYGKRFIDLAVDLTPSSPAGIIMPVTCEITNRGTSPSGPTTVALYEGSPDKNGQLISKADVPSLAPTMSHRAVFNWPLLKKTGTRTLFAVVDAENTNVEPNKQNNTASAEMLIPDLLYSITLPRESFGAHEDIAFGLFAANLTSKAYSDLSFTVDLVDSSGASVASSSRRLAEFRPGSEYRTERSLPASSLPAGTYQLRSRILNPFEISSAQADIVITPTLMLQGSFEGPSKAVSCVPFTVTYQIKSTGNLPISDGKIRLEMRSAGTSQLVYNEQAPLAIEAGSFVVENKPFPEDVYRISLKVLAVSQDNQVSREFLIDEKPVFIARPITVTVGNAAVPRVLCWLGQSSSGLQQAMAEKIARQAFEDEEVYYSFVYTAQEFTKQAQSGNFNTLVLFEPDERLDKARWLKNLVTRGQGLVLIGSDNSAQMIGDLFGFTFREGFASTGTMLTHANDSEMGLSGTMPISGRILLPKKSGAHAAATLTENGEPALLVDKVGSGQMIVIPFSLSRTAIDVGTSSLYSILVRVAIASATPKTEEHSEIASTALMVSSLAGPTFTRVVETLPPGTQVLWTSSSGSVKNNVITYELVADKYPQKLLYLSRPPAGKARPVVREIFYECDEAYVSQGTME